MRYCALALLWGLSASMMSCATLRKLSHVESREPASLHSLQSTSPLREKINSGGPMPLGCPAEVRALFPVLADERVKFPLCPERLKNTFERSKNALQMGERSTVEELLNTQCRMVWREAGTNPLDELIDGLAPRLTKGGNLEERENDSEAERGLRLQLRDALAETRANLGPMEQWVRLNGEFVIPEEQLVFFDRLLVQEKCRMSDREVDESYRVLRNIEDLQRMQTEGEAQRTKLDRFLAGVHRVIDRKIREYFRR